MITNNQDVTAKVTSIVNFGVFCEVEDNGTIYKGLIHISELSDFFVRDISTMFEIGEEIEVKVLEVIESKKQLKLSYKALKPELLKNSGSKLQENGNGFDTLKDSIDEFVED